MREDLNSKYIVDIAKKMEEKKRGLILFLS